MSGHTYFRRNGTTGPYVCGTPDCGHEASTARQMQAHAALKAVERMRRA